MNTTAASYRCAIAEQTAVQSRAAAAAFQTAWTAVVPPSLIAANRLRLTTLMGALAGRGVNNAKARRSSVIPPSPAAG